MSEEVVTLESLVGQHTLTGVDFETQTFNNGYRDEYCQVVNFVLDGETYTASEDPDDGYRSCMREIKKSNNVVKNMFASCNVIGTMRVPDYGTSEIIDLTDSITRKVVLSVGTENTDDYYPMWVADFTPENMAVNVIVDCAFVKTCRQ